MHADWLEPWEPIINPEFFEKELYHEVGNHQHVLYNKKVKTLARRGDREDFLFEVQGTDFSFAVVHLTFSKSASVDSKYPDTQVFKDINSWINDCMRVDHAKYIDNTD